MTGFETVETLRELEKKAIPCPWRYEPAGTSDAGNLYDDSIVEGDNWIFYDVGDEPDTHLIICLRNAAPLLLDVVGQIRPGDDKLLARLIYEQEEIARFAAGFGEVKQSERAVIDMLKRYQKMAERMHANHH